MSRSLAIVPPPHAAVQSPQERVAELTSHASNAVTEHLEMAMEAFALAAELAAQIAVGNELYPAGLKDLARRMAERQSADLSTFSAIAARRAP